ncbi:ferritin-like domain-containing protein [Rhizobium miluonense]|uniref:Ferritin-like n=1 Tax=Rhizobium miluonense TaxID=411945 RepID=A0A1C3U6J6_9HYPH|nr:ferritin-like protein [Rhizobium miluonense]SCB11108.1 Ferritin-like [Rhizobium miluonense]
MQTPSTVIENVEQLKEYLQVAIQLEHATIPPYLTAAYSAKIEVNKPSIDIISAVAKEEMLHLTLAANLLNAIGGQPDLISADFVPHYPAHLPTGQDDFDVSIEKLSDHALQTFLAIERPTSLKPEQADAVQYIEKTIPVSGQHIDKPMLESENPLVPITEAGDGNYEFHYKIAVVPHHQLTAYRRGISEAGNSLVPRVPTTSSPEHHLELHYWSIGEFYKAIHLGFVELANKMEMKALFAGDPKRQVDPKYYYSAGGELTAITDLKSALMAIDFIADQGEGSNQRVYDAEGELAHYYRFDQILKKRYYRDPSRDGARDSAGDPQGGRFPVDMEAVFPIKANAKISDYDGYPELKENALLFNGQYKRFLGHLNTAFNGQPELLGGAFTAEMFRIKVAMERLIHYPIPGTGENAAPTFEMDQFKDPPAVLPSSSAPAPATPATSVSHV